MEWKLFDDDHSAFADKEWYKEREVANHLDDSYHIERLLKAVEMVEQAISMGGKTVVDLGCGDGGLLYLLKQQGIEAWGYDLMPTNIDYAVNVRGVNARYTNFNADQIEYADITVMTETLEHMEDPHSVVKNLPSKYLVASSPYNENDINHYEHHLWAWDPEGYKHLLENNGYTVVEQHLVSGWSQVLLGVRQ
jgi:SAM-dependent methyltransferase